jgi:regulator of sigma E protease
MEILIKASQLILSLSILIVLHELGHFIPARLFKIKVEKFYLFFNPWFSLFKIKKGETEYGLGWLPLGGYVKIAGMIDESMDKEQMKQAPQPWEFRSKPAWQRLIVMAGGVTVNLILGIFIFIMITWFWGEDRLPAENLKYGVYCDSLALSLGFEHGDKILTLEGKKLENFRDLNKHILLHNARKISYERNGNISQITLPDDIPYKMLESGTKSLFSERFPAEIGFVDSTLPAHIAGIQKGDKIIAINNTPVSYWDEMSAEIKKHKNQTINIHCLRNNDTLNIPVKTTEQGTIGIGPKTMKEIFDIVHDDFSLVQSIPHGIKSGFGFLADQAKSMKFLFSSSGAKQMGGFGTFGSMFSPIWDWHSFWFLTAVISIILAFMNILPIPALDGGHIMFLLWEMITGKAPSQRFMEIAQTVGMIILLGLILFANINDIRKFFF